MYNLVGERLAHLAAGMTKEKITGTPREKKATVEGTRVLERGISQTADVGFRRCFPLLLNEEKLIVSESFFSI